MGDSAKPWTLEASLAAPGHDSAKPWAMPMQLAGGDSARPWGLEGSAGTYTRESFVQAITADNPAGWWRGNDVAGPNVVDSSGGGRTGVATAGVTFGAPSLVSGGGTALSYDGAQGKVAIPSSPLVGDFSLEAFVNLTGPGSVGSNANACIMGNALAQRMLISTGDGSILTQFGPNLFSPAGAVPFATRSQVVYTFDGSTVQKIYVNGAEVASGTGAGAAAFATAFFLGAYAEPSLNYSFKGIIDEAIIFNTVLSPGRVSAHWNAAIAS